MELPKNISINKHIIKLIEGKQSLYKPIYNINLVKLETLQIYIKSHLKTKFIQSFKSPTRVAFFLTKSLIIVFAYIWIIET